MSPVALITVNRALGLFAAAAIALFDQIAKFVVTEVLVLQNLPAGLRITPFFSLNWTQNHGVSMGIFTADTETQRWALVAMTAVIALGVAWWLWRERNRQDAFALGLVLGGAIGNILDRVRFGYVVDYADFHIGSWRPFLIFNLADAAITVGVLILLARALLLREKPRPKESN